MKSSAAFHLSSDTSATTQNSAPVSRFRCLFSHDLRRKAKRWQDGFLRFHSFNKRVMVYDTQGIFVGDLHWCEGEELNDGDELELERGVLVQVCECVEKTQTDLTELLSKKTHVSTSSTARGAGSNGNTSPNSSGRLKSLNEVLGIQRTPIGRVALPAKSPYEERHQTIRLNDGAEATAERAPKRQRQDARERGNDADRSSWQNPLRDSSSYASASNSFACFQPARDLACNKSTTSKSSSKRTPGTTKRGERGEKTKSQTVIDLTNSSGSFNTLQIAIEKPRRKLMYKDLLPPQAVQRSKERQDSEKSRGDKQSLLVLEDSAAETVEAENIPSPVHTVKPAALLSTAEVDNTLHFVPSSSTLHALLEADPPPSSQRTKYINLFLNPSVQKPPVASTTNNQKESTASHAPPPAPQSAQCTTISPVTSPTTETFPPSPPDNRPLSTRRLLVRDHSDITPSLAIANNTSDPTPPVPRPRIHQTIQRSDSLPTIAERSKPAAAAPPPPLDPAAPSKSFQKSLPDTSSVLGRTTLATDPAPRMRQSLLAPKRNQHVATCVDVDEKGQGPWTEEALDLFDWWPAGRPKPEGRKVVGGGNL
ncbi:hypothetical protein PAAG_04942 [Paracoccidioides lutzii Pb01]|uniref:5'-3' DNA helicase ZGRF1-like N-terminal domain-containing protein n=1 Tax=Paracoccidioides lutzii (strain ATCC MYA-826 / Pb01) TaxID=502779 RepID=C1H206_PARBA|nr:hypothetical protein PAAG_04942 [Paracoccidioides lutzii Pb01]EEH33893.1 hypothetical protein PAAG_04942 [Paracoccidioides lutzii Pb01]